MADWSPQSHPPPTDPSPVVSWVDVGDACVIRASMFHDDPGTVVAELPTPCPERPMDLGLWFHDADALYSTTLLQFVRAGSTVWEVVPGGVARRAGPDLPGLAGIGVADGSLRACTLSAPSSPERAWTATYYRLDAEAWVELGQAPASSWIECYGAGQVPGDASPFENALHEPSRVGGPFVTDPTQLHDASQVFDPAFSWRNGRWRRIRGLGPGPSLAHFLNDESVLVSGSRRWVVVDWETGERVGRPHPGQAMGWLLDPIAEPAVAWLSPNEGKCDLRVGTIVVAALETCDASLEAPAGDAWWVGRAEPWDVVEIDLLHRRTRPVPPPPAPAAEFDVGRARAAASESTCWYYTDATGGWKAYACAAELRTREPGDATERHAGALGTVVMEPGPGLHAASSPFPESTDAFDNGYAAVGWTPGPAVYQRDPDGSWRLRARGETGETVHLTTRYGWMLVQLGDGPAQLFRAGLDQPEWTAPGAAWLLPPAVTLGDAAHGR